MSAAWLLVTLAAGFIWGWAAAHNEVARECDRLGSFYVGKTVYVCARKETK